jgi:dynactin 1
VIAKSLLADEGYRIHSQFDHLAQTYLPAFEYDIGEREQGMALSFDHDLDMFTAAVGLAKTSIQAIMKEDGQYAWVRQRLTGCLSDADMVIDNGGADFDTDLFSPIQNVLQKVKSAQAQSRHVSSDSAFLYHAKSSCCTRKLTKRLEEVVGDSAAIKPHFIPKMNAINELLPELTDFAISVR